MRVLLPLALAAGLSVSPAHAACTYPKAPTNIPDGATATLEEMKAAQQAVKQYDQDISAYLACLKLEHDAAIARAGDELTEERKQELERIQIQKHNAAIDELEAVAARFNEQVRVFRERNEKKNKS